MLRLSGALSGQMEKVQKRATKVLPRLSQLWYTQPLPKLDLPTLVYRRARLPEVI